MAAGRYLTSAWRTLSAAFTLDPTGERFAFARFRGGGGDEIADGGGGGAGLKAVAAFDPGATELTEMNGAAAAQRKKVEDSGKDASDVYPAEDHGYSDSESKHDRNRISAWQAGWNVTNAIQVKNCAL